MPKKKLTDEGIKALKPPPMRRDAKGNAIGSIDYFDAYMPGLVLRVNYGGKKMWRVLYYVKRVNKDGKRVTLPRLHPLKPYPILKLKEAREAARKFLADPQAALRQGAEGTFKETAENWFKRHVQHNALRSEPEIKRCLERYVYPHWEHQAFLELRRGDVTDLLDKIADEHGPRQADAVLAIIRGIMFWYQSSHDDYVSPIVRGMKRSKTADRERVLSDDEIRALFKACDDNGVGGACAKMLLLTAQRREKVAGMKRHEVKDGQWHIAKTSTREKSTGDILPLPKPALDLINSQAIVSGNPYVFPGGEKGRRRVKDKPDGLPHFNSFSQLKKELDAKMRAQLGSFERWTFHDLRRTARTLMSRTNVNSDIAELTLGHTIKGVRKVYDRHKYVAQKGEALKQLAHVIDTIIKPPRGNVVAITGRKRRTKSPAA